MNNQREMIEALLDGEKLVMPELSSSSIIEMDDRGITRYTHGALCDMNEICSPQVWQIYKEPKWYENIPDSGVLCRCNDGLIVDITESSASRLINKKGSFFTFDFVTPLTKQEIQAFMENAPDEL